MADQVEVLFRATDAGSGRFQSYSQVRRLLLSGWVRPRSRVIVALVS